MFLLFDLFAAGIHMRTHTRTHIGAFTAADTVRNKERVVFGTLFVPILGEYRKVQEGKWDMYIIYIYTRARAHTHTHTQEDAGRYRQI